MLSKGFRPPPSDDPSNILSFMVKVSKKRAAPAAPGAKKRAASAVPGAKKRAAPARAKKAKAGSNPNRPSAPAKSSKAPKALPAQEVQFGSDDVPLSKAFQWPRRFMDAVQSLSGLSRALGLEHHLFLLVGLAGLLAGWLLNTGRSC